MTLLISSDVSVDAPLSGNVHATLRFVRVHPKAFASFATKVINQEMLHYEPQCKKGIRISLLPYKVSKMVDVRTNSMEKHLAAVNDFYQAS
jgi:DNA-directed RNA polymerase specialized sigma subunit